MQFRKLTQTIERLGTGLHSGREFRLTIEPSDGPLALEADGMCLPVSKLALEGTGRGSDLIFPDGKRVRTCEHVLSPLAGLGVWHAKFSVTSVTSVTGGFPLEMPGLDGCSLSLGSEIMEKSVPCEHGQDEGLPFFPFALKHPLKVGDEARFVAAFPSDSFHITYIIDYDAAPVGTRIFDFYGRGGADYLKEIAPARTFAMRRDIEALRAAGMALGGSLDNAVLVDDTGVETAGGLRFADEFVRHKVLDLLGDLACLGRPLAAHVVAVRAGHVQHLQLVERLRAVSGLQ